MLMNFSKIVPNRTIYFQLILFTIFLIINFKFGYVISPDGLNFIESSNILKDRGFSYFFTENFRPQGSFSYLFTIILICFLKILFSDFWPYIFILLNLLIYFFIYYLLIILSKKLKLSLICQLFLTLIFFIFFQV